MISGRDGRGDIFYREGNAVIHAIERGVEPEIQQEGEEGGTREPFEDVLFLLMGPLAERRDSIEQQEQGGACEHDGRDDVG